MSYGIAPKSIPPGGVVHICLVHSRTCRQDAYFHYLFGVQEEDWYGAVDIRSGRSLLFMPRLPQAYAVWMVRRMDC